MSHPQRNKTEVLIAVWGFILFLFLGVAAIVIIASDAGLLVQ